MSKKEGEKKENDFVKWFSELSNKDVAIAGGKGASLAEMYNNKFPVPPGFIVTAQAYQYLIEKSGLKEKIKDVLNNLDIEDTDALNKAAKKIRELIENAEMPKDMGDEIIEAYEVLDVDREHIAKAGSKAMDILKTSHEMPFVAVRSSATTEDLAEASFAGQQETFLNVKGNRQLLLKVKECFASLFTARAVYYREKKGFKHDKAYLAVVVQRMIDSDKSGVIFSKNPVKNDNNVVIEAVWGLGEGIVSGRIKPDYYAVDSDLNNFNLVESKIVEKDIAIVRDSSGENKIAKLTKERSKQQVLSNYEIKRLAQYALKLQEHYGKPQDIEFAIEGNEIYIVQSRPITTKAREGKDEEIQGKILLSGLGASPGVSSGVVKIVHNMDELNKIKKGDVLVTKMTNPDMVVAMQKSAAIVTDEGGVTSHAAIVSREMGIPAVVGTNEATAKLKDGEIVTVDGNSGRVFEGKAETKLAEVKEIVPTRTKIKVIVDLPDFAMRAAKSGAREVGLVRLEGIIASSGKHPIKYVKDKKIEDYTSVLASGLKKIVEPFDEIWIRSSDIRSDEFRHLEGAPKEIEGNPMLGDHGIRFSLKHPDIMKAELTAIKEIANNFPQKKIGLMAPQIISVDEVRKMKELANNIGMPANVKVGIMVETPAAVEVIEDLCKEGINFISFGSNDLTQYILAIDRNNADVQHLYNEMNPAVLNAIAHVIKVCRKYNVETSICGQAGSREDMVRFLLSQGIDSISVNADAAYNISKLVTEVESSIIRETNLSEGDTYDKEKEVEDESQLETGQEIMVPMMEAIPMSEASADKQGDTNKDVEEIALDELGDDYVPGDIDKKEDIPKLNEAINVEASAEAENESGQIEEKHEELHEENKNEGKELEQTEEQHLGDDKLSEEWKGERHEGEKPA